MLQNIKGTLLTLAAVGLMTVNAFAASFGVRQESEKGRIVTFLPGISAEAGDKNPHASVAGSASGETRPSVGLRRGAYAGLASPALQRRWRMARSS